MARKKTADTTPNTAAGITEALKGGVGKTSEKKVRSIQARAKREGKTNIPVTSAIVEADPGYRTSGEVGKGRSKEGIGSGAPLDVRERKQNKQNAILRLMNEGATPAERENAANAARKMGLIK